MIWAIHSQLVFLIDRQEQFIHGRCFLKIEKIDDQKIKFPTQGFVVFLVFLSLGALDILALPYNVFKPISDQENFKGAVSRDFWHFFISRIKAIWAPDNQAKMVLLKCSFSRWYSQKIWLRAG